MGLPYLPLAGQLGSQVQGPDLTWECSRRCRRALHGPSSDGKLGGPAPPCKLTLENPTPTQKAEALWSPSEVSDGSQTHPPTRTLPRGPWSLPPIKDLTAWASAQALPRCGSHPVPEAPGIHSHSLRPHLGSCVGSTGVRSKLDASVQDGGLKGPA